MKDYRGAVGRAECEYIIERSRFITAISAVDSEAEAKEFVSEVRKKHSLATHNCYAYIADEVGLIMKFSDDGEPQGTAGMPILDVLQKSCLKKTAIVVTRYFGGIKLGAGGLVRAYSKAAADGVAAIKKAEYRVCDEIVTVTDYEQYGRLLKLAESKQLLTGRAEFSDNIRLSIYVPENQSEELVASLTDAFNGRLTVINGNKSYRAFEL